MNFDFLVETLLQENSKKRYKVSCYKYGVASETLAASSKQAIAHVAVNFAKSKKLNKSEYGRIISDFKKCAKAKEIQGNLQEGFEKEKKEGLHGWFSRNRGKGWINCKKSKKGKLVPCGREKGTKSGKGYPACRPTLSMCSGSKRKKKSSKRITWKKNK